MSVRILTGDVRERLRDLEPESVQCVVTSPPYFGLRDYGTAQWDGGDPACDHVSGNARNDVTPDRLAERAAQYGTGQGSGSAVTKMQYSDQCRKCGAVRVDRQIGLEATLAEYVETLVAVFREVRRVLRPDGTVWLNLGDSYAAARGGTHQPAETLAGGKNGYMADGGRVNRDRHDGYNPTRDAKAQGLKHKDLMMVPARVALALQADGWWLRSHVIWAKKNCMPESVTDRPTSSHESIFLLTKQARYFYDAEAVREEAINEGRIVKATGDTAKNNGTGNVTAIGFTNHDTLISGRNQRNVWHLATEPFPDAHFATFPTEIPRRCIKAGTSEKGQCAACGAPWVRVVEREAGSARHNPGYTALCSGRNDGDRPGSYTGPKITERGWQPSCTCNADVVPQTVLDPFLGSGTTLLVADQLGRHGVGIELNPEYAAMAEKRIRNDAPMFAEVLV